MNQVKIDAMQKVLPVEKRVVGGDSEWCVSLNATAKFYQYRSIDVLCNTHHLNLIEDVNMVRSGEVVWMPIEYATEIVKRQEDLNWGTILKYFQSFDKTHDVAEPRRSPNRR
jgi:hypothetical protein